MAGQKMVSCGAAGSRLAKPCQPGADRLPRVQRGRSGGKLPLQRFSSQHIPRSAPPKPASSTIPPAHLWRHLLCRQDLLWQRLDAVKVKPLEQRVELSRGSLDHLQRRSKGRGRAAGGAGVQGHGLEGEWARQGSQGANDWAQPVHNQQASQRTWRQAGQASSTPPPPPPLATITDQPHHPPPVPPRLQTWRPWG